MHWDVDTMDTSDMPMLLFVQQSNTVTKSVIVDRMRGNVFVLVNHNGEHYVDFKLFGQDVWDRRFKSQRLVRITPIHAVKSLKPIKRDTSRKNTSLVSLTGVVVTTGARRLPAAIRAAAGISRLGNLNRTAICTATLCHADLHVVNTPYHGRWKHNIHLEKLFIEIQRDSRNAVVYDREEFPGIRVRCNDTAGVMTFFSSGRFLVVGLSQASLVNILLQRVYPYIVNAMLITPVLHTS